MKIINGVFFTVLLLFNGACIASEISGTIVPPFPERWKNLGGACIAASLGVDKYCDYSIGVLENVKQRILYFGKLVPNSNAKKAQWLIIDEMSYPVTQLGFQVIYGLCERNRKIDETIIATVKSTDTEWYTTVKLAYRANLKTEHIEKISINEIRCLNEGWGL